MRASSKRERAVVAAVIVLAWVSLPFAPCRADSDENAQAASQSGTSSDKKAEDAKATPAAPAATGATTAKPATPAKTDKAAPQKPAAPAKPGDPKKEPAKKPKGQVNTIEDLYAEPNPRPATAAGPERAQGI